MQSQKRVKHKEGDREQLKASIFNTQFGDLMNSSPISNIGGVCVRNYKIVDKVPVLS